MKIHYISAPAGSGKTELLTDFVIELANDHSKVILIQPTIALINQTEERIKTKGFQGTLKCVTSETAPSNVVKEIHAFLSTIEPDSGCILILTFAAWKMVHRRNVNGWRLIVDECPNVFHYVSIHAKFTHNHITDNLETEDYEKDGYARLIPKTDACKKALIGFSEKAKQDRALEMLRPIVSNLHDNVVTYVKPDTYEKLLSGEGSLLTTYNVVKPRVFAGFKQVIILSANFEDSEFYNIYKHYGVQFEPHRGLRDRILPSVHPPEVGQALDIYYLVDDWSIGKRREKQRRAVYEAEFKRAIKEKIDGRPFIYNINSSDNQSFFEGLANAIRVPAYPHGLNKFRNTDCVAIYSIFNNSADRVDFLNAKCGIDKTFAWNITNFNYIYQIACRSSLRLWPSDSEEIHPKIVIIMDKDSAEYLHNKFPGSKLHKFCSPKIDQIATKEPGRKPSGLTNSERVKKTRALSKEMNIDACLSALQNRAIHMSPSASPEIRNEIALNEIDSVDNKIEEEKWPINILGTIKGYVSDIIYVDGYDAFCDHMAKVSERHIFDKAKNMLINATEFVGEGSLPPNRKLESVVKAPAIWLDMDKGNKCPFEFAELCSAVEMLIYSSFNSAAGERKWRVVIPLKRWVSREEYNKIAKLLHRAFEMKGFSFDSSKKQSNDFFYLPCHGKHEDAFFFQRFEGDGRSFLDPDNLLRLA